MTISEGELEVQRAIGRLEGRLSTLEKQVLEIHSDTKEMRALLNQAKGGWKTWVVIAGIAGSVGAFAGKFLPFFR